MSCHSPFCIQWQTHARFSCALPDPNSCADKSRVPALFCPGCRYSSAMTKLSKGEWEGEVKFLHALHVGYILFIVYFAGIKSVSDFVAANLSFLKRSFIQDLGRWPVLCLLEYRNYHLSG